MMVMNVIKLVVLGILPPLIMGVELVCHCDMEDRRTFCPEEASGLDACSVSRDCANHTVLLHYLGKGCLPEVKKCFPSLKAVWVGSCSTTDIRCFCQQDVLILNYECEVPVTPPPSSPKQHTSLNLGLSCAGAFLGGILLVAGVTGITMLVKRRRNYAIPDRSALLFRADEGEETTPSAV